MRLPALVLACALLLAACGSGEASSFALIDPAEREPAPDVRAETLEGEELGLADLDGGPVLINFWASWCGPCIEEAPALRNIHDAYADEGLHVVGVNVRDRTSNARRFERELGIPYPSWTDPAAEIAARFGGIGPAALPSTLILDAEHRVAVRLFGAVTFAELQGYVEPLLDEADPDRDAAS